MKIVVDAFGGDNAPMEIVSGAVDALNLQPDLSLVLVGDENKIKSLLEAEKYDNNRLFTVHASDIITGDDSPTMAIKQKKDSSLVRALDILAHDNSVGGFMSAGPTGAVLAGAFMIVGRIKGISRPALAPLLPTVKGKGVILCDCGANVDCKAINLVHFAYMAKAFAQAMTGNVNPKIALLSNGTEEKKGSELNREVYDLLKADKDVNFVGNCEARDVMSGDFDVVVSDGFNGNIALKAAEGTANAIFTFLKNAIDENGLKAKIGALLLKPALRQVKRKMDYNSQGGACFLGVNKVVVKAHGSATKKAVTAAILQANDLAKADICATIKEKLSAQSETAEQIDK